MQNNFILVQYSKVLPDCETQYFDGIFGNGDVSKNTNHSNYGQF